MALVRDLTHDSGVLTAIEDHEDPLWNTYPPELREKLFALNTILAKQTRPVILAAFHHFSKEDLTALISDLVAVIVRFQIIGRQRTGTVEKVLAQDLPGHKRWTHPGRAYG